LSKFVKHAFFKPFIILLLSVFPTLLTSVSIYTVSASNTTQTTARSLDAIGQKQLMRIDDCREQIFKDLEFYSHLNILKELNITEIKDLFQYTESIDPLLENLYVFDLEGNILTSSQDNMNQMDDKTYLKTALQGGRGVSKVFKLSGNYYIELTVPIKSNNQMIGGICGRVNLNIFNEMIKTTELGGSVECYLVDENGTFLTQSKYFINAVGKKKVDIKRIKTSIDYSNTKPYTDYRDIRVLGAYFPVEQLGWYLIIEQDADEVNKATRIIQLISEIITSLQIIGIALLKRVIELNQPTVSTKNPDTLSFDELNTLIEIMMHDSKENRE
jgi:hypothetical protein